MQDGCRTSFAFKTAVLENCWKVVVLHTARFKRVAWSERAFEWRVPSQESCFYKRDIVFQEGCGFQERHCWFTKEYVSKTCFACVSKAHASYCIVELHFGCSELCGQWRFCRAIVLARSQTQIVLRAIFSRARKHAYQKRWLAKLCRCGGRGRARPQNVGIAGD